MVVQTGPTDSNDMAGGLKPEPESVEDATNTPRSRRRSSTSEHFRQLLQQMHLDALVKPFG